MTESSKPREIWITRHPDSVDHDKLTHIALFEYHADKNPVKFIEAYAYDAALARIAQLESALEYQKKKYQELNSKPSDFQIIEEQGDMIQKRDERIKLLEEVCAELMKSMDVAKLYLESCGYRKLEKWEPERQMLEDFERALASAREKMGGGK